MSFPLPLKKFSRFLCDAKIATYAAGDNRVPEKPILPGSHQLEFRQGALFYRDIYYGGAFFVGQEIVYYRDNPFWSMCYAGGANEGVDTDHTPRIYEFLSAALREVPESDPYRGPASFKWEKFSYTNRILGIISRFSGVEMIFFQDRPVYQLHYNGGLLIE